MREHHCNVLILHKAVKSSGPGWTASDVEIRLKNLDRFSHLYPGLRLNVMNAAATVGRKEEVEARIRKLMAEDRSSDRTVSSILERAVRK